MKLGDFKGFFKKSYLDVISVENPYKDYYQIRLKFNRGYKWIPGEHAIFSMPDRHFKGKQWRAFSIASIEEEGYVLIGTKTGESISIFKENLIDMNPGERIKVRGPFGWFKLKKDNKPINLIATGVGITPIRALLKELEYKTDRKVNIVYSSSFYYLFEHEIEQIANNNESITLYKTKNKKETQEKIKALAKEYGNEAYYYVSGSLSVLKATKKILQKNNISKTQIVRDPFLGY